MNVRQRTDAHLFKLFNDGFDFADVCFIAFEDQNSQILHGLNVDVATKIQRTFVLGIVTSQRITRGLVACNWLIRLSSHCHHAVDLLTQVFCSQVRHPFVGDQFDGFCFFASRFIHLSDQPRKMVDSCL